MIIEFLILTVGLIIAAGILAKYGKFVIVKVDANSGGKAFFGTSDEVHKLALQLEHEQDMERQKQWHERTMR